MCSGQAPKQFGGGKPLGAGAGNTTTPPTVYASSVNPSLTDASIAPGAAPVTPTAPAAPKIPGSSTNLGQNNQQNNNPFISALIASGMF